MSTVFALRVVPGLLLALAPLTLAQAQTVTVNCGKGKTIQKVLNDQQASGAPLIVEIRGMCREAVVVKRGLVTLRGADPDADGIQAPSGAANALTLQHVLDVLVENLTIAGASDAGLVVEDSSRVSVGNCRIIDNLGVGLRAVQSRATFSDTAFSRNGTGGAFVAYGGAGFTRCTFTDNHRDPENGDSALSVYYGVSSLIDSSITDWSALNIIRSRFIGQNSQLASNGSETPAVNAYFGSNVSFTGGTISGKLSAGSTDVTLFGVNLTPDPSESCGINLYGTGTLRVGVPWRAGETSTIPCDVRLSAFANATIEVGNTVDMVFCNSGADAWCDDLSNVRVAFGCGKCVRQ
jgi:hypothetical protein